MLTIKGDLFYTIKFFIVHYDFAGTILGLAALYFVGQFFMYRITIKMAVNVPLFVFTSKNIMLIHESYALSRHKLNFYQVAGMAISWFFILFQAFTLVRK